MIRERSTMSITFSITVQSVARAPAVRIDARQLAAFRHFARDHGQLPEYDDPANNDPLPYAFDARVCQWSMASICALFDHDVGVIAVIEEAQFRRLNVQFWKDGATNDLYMGVSRTVDGSVAIRLTNQKACDLLAALGLDPAPSGSVAMRDLAGRVNDDPTLDRLPAKDHSEYLGQLETITRHCDDIE